MFANSCWSCVPASPSSAIRSSSPSVNPTVFSTCLSATSVSVVCVVVELKAGAFKPEHADKMNFYLSAVDVLKHKDDQPSIGFLLCRSRNRVQVEYALRDIQKPIGVAEWETRIVAQLPKSLRGSLPTVEEIEAELAPKPAK